MSRGAISMRLMETEKKGRRDWALELVEDLRSVPRQDSRPITQFVRRRAIVQIWDRVSPDGIRYQSITIGRLYERDGKPAVNHDLEFRDVRECRKALRDAKGWWREERKRSRPTLWKKLAWLLPF